MQKTYLKICGLILECGNCNNKFNDIKSETKLIRENYDLTETEDGYPKKDYYDIRECPKCHKIFRVNK